MFDRCFAIPFCVLPVPLLVDLCSSAPLCHHVSSRGSSTVLGLSVSTGLLVWVSVTVCVLAAAVHTRQKTMRGTAGTAPGNGSQVLQVNIWAHIIGDALIWHFVGTLVALR